jgi:hypothetical protein
VQLVAAEIATTNLFETRPDRFAAC